MGMVKYDSSSGKLTKEEINLQLFKKKDFQQEYRWLPVYVFLSRLGGTEYIWTILLWKIVSKICQKFCFKLAYDSFHWFLIKD